MNIFFILIIILIIIYIGHKTFFDVKTTTATTTPTTQTTPTIPEFNVPEMFRTFNENKSNNIKLFIFVSEHCPHCHTYLNNQHNNVCDIAKSYGVEVEKIVSDGSAKSSELFDKFNVKFVPTAIIVKNDGTFKNLGSNITPQSIKYALEN